MLPRSLGRVGIAAACAMLFGGAAPASAAVGGFEGGDGNQTCETLADWACPSGTVLRADDAVGTSDDLFKSGSKETKPDDWQYVTGSEQAKSNLATVWRTTVEPTVGQSFLNLGLKRAGGEAGNSYFAFELSQTRGTWVNAAGTRIPCRTDGDVLVSYDIVAVPPQVRLYEWVGSGGPEACRDGAQGSWGPGTLASASEANLNAAALTNVLGGYAPGTTFAPQTFGEASLDLGGIADELDFTKTCEFFTQLQAHSRSSNEETATLQDRVASIAISVVACEPDPGGGGGGGGDVTPPDVPTIGDSASCLQSRSVTLSGVTEPGAQVAVRDGAGSVGLDDADAAGAWSITLTDVTDGAHAYSATAIDAAGNVSGASSSVPVFVDASPDVAPVITSPAAGSSMVQGPLVLTGTAEPGSTVAVSDGTTFLGSVVASGTGAWQYTIDGPALGVHDLAAMATDGCNASATTARSSVTVTDTTGGTGDGGGGGGGGGGTSTGSTTTTTGGLAPVAGTSGLGSLPLSVVPLGGMPTACAGKVFTTFVTDKKNLLRRVVFKVDGKVVATVKKRDKQRRFLVRINPRKYKAGERRLTATLVPKSKRTKQTTVTRRFRRCDACKSRRGFSIRLVRPGGEKLRSATVFVNNRKVRTIRGSRLTAPVRLVGLPKGTYKVRIRAVTVSGRVSTSVRTYRTCAKKVARKLATKKRS